MGGKGRKPLISYQPGDPDSVEWATAKLYGEGFVALVDARAATEKRRKLQMGS